MVATVKHIVRNRKNILFVTVKLFSATVKLRLQVGSLVGGVVWTGWFGAGW